MRDFVPSATLISLPLSARKVNTEKRDYLLVSPAKSRRIVEYLSNCFKMRLTRQKKYHNMFDFLDQNGQIVARAVICRDAQATVDWVRVG